MSSLLTRIQTEVIAAMKSRDSVRLETLRLIVSQAKYKQIETQKDLTDEDIITVIRKQIKELTEASAQFSAAGRNDLSEANTAQVNILQSYLPAEISDEELKKLIQGFIDENMPAFTANPRVLTGKVIGALRSKASPDRISKMYGQMMSKV
ncbi:MAG: GatB/YqeY domain-containing protein [Candidatus Roizmanbacteria bacterium]